MKRFSQLFMRYLLILLLANLGVIAFSAFTLKQQAVEEQHQLAFFIKTNFQTSDLVLLSEQSRNVTRSNMFDTFTVKSAEEHIYSFDSTNKSFSLLTPSADQVSFSNSDVTISLQISTKEIEHHLLLTAALLVSISLIVALLFAANGRKLQESMIEQVAKVVQNTLSKDAQSTTTAEEKELLSESSVLSNAVKEIDRKMDGEQKNRSLLEKEAYIEPLTELENRTRFVQFFEEKDGVMEFGVLTITRCSELQTINQIHGYQEGDNYIRKVSDIIKNVIGRYQGAKVFRLNSSDFACIIPNAKIKVAEEFAEQLTNKFNDYQSASDLDSVGYTGLVAFDKESPLGELLALADTGISVAQTQHKNAWYSQTDTSILESSSASYGNQNWRQEIDSVLENTRVNLLVQHIKPSSRNAKMYSEILARFLNSDNELLPTASFIAMSEKLDKIIEVDRMIVEQAIELIKSKNLTEQQFGINLSARSIHDEHFAIWLERRLLRDPSVSSSLIFEITEHGLQQNIKTSKRFIDMLHRVGSRVTVERFGVGLTSFKFFRDLKPDYIKMDSMYTRDIDEDKNNQYFLRLMVDLAHRLSISVLAESVESQEEKYTLEKLFIDGCQGYYIGKPEAM